MPRDYSSRRNNRSNSSGKRKSGKRPASAARPVRRKKSTPRKKTASSGNQRRNTASAQTGPSGCIWLLCAVFICVAGGSAYYIATRPAGHGPEGTSLDLPDEQQVTTDDKSGSEPDHNQPQDKQQKTESKPEFSFYQMLPNYKIKVPEGQEADKPVVDKNAPHETEPTKDTPKPAQSGKTAADASVNYVIQAGAFSTRADADHRKAKLTLLGVTADVVDMHTDSDKTIYRVQSSTLGSRKQAEKLSQRLQSHGIDTIVRQAQ